MTTTKPECPECHEVITPIVIAYKDGGLHGLSGWYWVNGPEPKVLYGTKQSALDQAAAVAWK